MKSCESDREGSVKERFTRVAQTPLDEKAFPLGSESAQRLGYNPSEWNGLPPEVIDSFCGVGNPLSLGEPRPGQTVVDLGCGAGWDSILAAKKVGPGGHVIGVDFCEAMLAKAKRNADFFRLGQVEWMLCHLEQLPLPSGSVDLVISNGVFNLCQDKPKVLGEIDRVLRPGGRLQVADVLLDESVSSEEVARVGSWSD